jgi:hypothetical protein
MAETLSQDSDLLARPSYLPRVTRHDGRAIEEALAGPSLFDVGVKLDGAVVEATYAVEDSPLLKRLRESRVPQLIDPQTLRFTGERFLTVAQFDRVPYRPAAPIAADSFTQAEAEALARGVLLFEQEPGASWYLAAALPYYDEHQQSWLAHNDRLLTASCAANGGADLDRRPLIAQVTAGRRLLARPELIVNRLLDHPVSAVYVQPLTLDPVKDSVEKLVEYVHFLRAIRDAGLPVIASRVGAFGLVLGALGIQAFDSGLAQAEASNLASLNRAPSKRELEGNGKGGGPDRRIYLEQLKTSSRVVTRQPFWRIGRCGPVSPAHSAVVSIVASRTSPGAVASITSGCETTRSTCSGDAQPKACASISCTSSYAARARLGLW